MDPKKKKTKKNKCGNKNLNTSAGLEVGSQIWKKKEKEHPATVKGRWPRNLSSSFWKRLEFTRSQETPWLVSGDADLPKVNADCFVIIQGQKERLYEAANFWWLVMAYSRQKEWPMWIFIWTQSWTKLTCARLETWNHDERDVNPPFEDLQKNINIWLFRWRNSIKKKNEK